MLESWSARAIEQVQLLKLSGDVAASWELPGTTLLAQLQPLAEAAVVHPGRLVLVLPDGQPKKQPKKQRRKQEANLVSNKSKPTSKQRSKQRNRSAAPGPSWGPAARKLAIGTKFVVRVLYSDSA